MRRDPVARRRLCYAGNNLVSQIPDARTITILLRELAQGQHGALDRLVPLVYKELRRIAEGQLRRERGGHTLQPTALVHEVYMRMVVQQQADYRDRAHFLAIAAHAMRRILIDHAREHSAAKRGGGLERFAIDEERDGCLERPFILIALDDSLTALAGKDPLLAQLVELRYFGGLTAEESSVALNLEVNAVRRQLRMAEAWLQREMEHPASGSVSAPAT
jgi:RNA polymerase sigma-70 factor, ECF subfamily